MIYNIKYIINIIITLGYRKDRISGYNALFPSPNQDMCISSTRESLKEAYNIMWPSDDIQIASARCKISSKFIKIYM